MPAYYIILPNKRVEYKKHRTYFQCLGGYRLLEHTYCTSIEQKMEELKQHDNKKWEIIIKVISDNSVSVDLCGEEIIMSYLDSSSTITSNSVFIIKSLLNNDHIQKVLDLMNIFYILNGSFKTKRTL